MHSPLPCMHAALLHPTLSGLSPGALVFGCDMYLDLPLIANILTLTNACQLHINTHLLCENHIAVNNTKLVTLSSFTISKHPAKNFCPFFLVCFPSSKSTPTIPLPSFGRTCRILGLTTFNSSSSICQQVGF